MNLLWLQRLSCCGNTHSLLNYEHFELLCREFNFLFHPSLSIQEEEEVVEKVLSREVELNFLLVEGAVEKEDEVVLELARRADYVIAVGNCASYGNIPALEDEEIMGLQFRFKEKGGLLGKDFVSKRGLPVVNLSGCPTHPEWIAGTLLKLKTAGGIELDEMGRPKDYYTSLTHWGCPRNEYFEWKVETESLGSGKGCLFYNFGCRGPMTGSTCNVILWNGVSSKTRAGTPCFGCTEFDFPRENLWETRLLAGLPAELPKGVSRRGYIMISGIAKTFAPERLKR